MIVDRALGQSIPAGVFDAVFYRATHDGPTSNDNGYDTGFPNVFPTIKGVRGAYHYAHPAASSAQEQAGRFIKTVLAHGFRKNVDLWMLDVEHYSDLRGAPLLQWIRDFMHIVTAALGDRGFLYIGYPYITEEGERLEDDIAVLHEFRWWLPAYGPNDGQDHGVTPGLPVKPVLHQFTSVPYDKSAIVDATRWHEMFLEGTVSAQFNPPLSIVSWTQFKDRKGRTSVAGVAANGAVFCIPADAYMGGMNGDPNFKGRVAARIVDARTMPAPWHGDKGYTIIDTAKEPYSKVI